MLWLVSPQLDAGGLLPSKLNGGGRSGYNEQNKNEVFSRFFSKHAYRVILGTNISEKPVLEPV
jgi:hypothetical protein